MSLIQCPRCKKMTARGIGSGKAKCYNKSCYEINLEFSLAKEPVKEEPVKKVAILEITNCMKCPHVEKDRTESAGFALDYKCSAKDGKLIKGYVEWKSEEPKDYEIPEWCPFLKVKE